MCNPHGRCQQSNGQLKTQTALGSALTHTRFEEENASVIIFIDLNPT